MPDIERVKENIMKTAGTVEFDFNTETDYLDTIREYIAENYDTALVMIREYYFLPKDAEICIDLDTLTATYTPTYVDIDLYVDPPKQCEV